MFSAAVNGTTVSRADKHDTRNDQPKSHVSLKISGEVS